VLYKSTYLLYSLNVAMMAGTCVTAIAHWISGKCKSQFKCSDIGSVKTDVVVVHCPRCTFQFICWCKICMIFDTVCKHYNRFVVSQAYALLESSLCRLISSKICWSRICLFQLYNLIVKLWLAMFIHSQHFVTRTTSRMSYRRRRRQAVARWSVSAKVVSF